MANVRKISEINMGKMENAGMLECWNVGIIRLGCQPFFMVGNLFENIYILEYWNDGIME
ncbi:MAG: hypothetical protein K8R41_09275 [Bacteroidales bacterium]|nr:hypothetical protein [Bacteroidales bacterium]